MVIDKNISLTQVASRVNNLNMDDQVLVIDVVDPFKLLSYPLRFEVLLIGLVREGEGEISIDLKNYRLERDTLLVLYPSNYIYSATGNTDLKMEVVAVSLDVVEGILPKLTDLMPLLMHHRAEPVEKLSGEEGDNLHQFISFLKDQLSKPKTPFLRQKVICLLQAALFEMMDMHFERSGAPEHRKSRKEEIMAKFILLVSEHFRTQRRVTFYADKMCITSKHLTAVVKEISGRTAGEWIERYVIVEAKVLLKSTDLTIQEIATKLNFPNQSFFGKYFKHQTGLSPSEYRRKQS